MKLFLSIHLTLIILKTHKCDVASSKYAQAVYTSLEIPTLMRQSQRQTVSECAIDSVPLIVGGSRVKKREFPHMAIIGFGLSPNSVLTWDCGGSLISDIYVLTAAHCLESRELGPAQKIRLGTINLNSRDPEVQEKLVMEKIPHPLHTTRSKANDIALIKMASPVKFTPYVRPACLYIDDIGFGGKALATGFGKISYDAKHGSKDLMKVALEVLSNDQCSKTLSSKEPIIESMLCAGHISGGRDTCQGDSGGPLQIILETPYCMYAIVGVTSFGKFCGFANSPAIYTKVSSFVPWIESIVWG